MDPYGRNQEQKVSSEEVVSFKLISIKTQITFLYKTYLDELSDIFILRGAKWDSAELRTLTKLEETKRSIFERQYPVVGLNQIETKIMMRFIME